MRAHYLGVTMKKIVLSFLLLLALSPPAWAQSITVPATIQVDQPGLVVIRATAIDADDVRWWPASHPALQTFPPDVLVVKHGVFVALAMQPGTYKVGVVTAKTVGGKAVLSNPAYCTITVGAPGPGPGPDLAVTVQKAYTADADPQKAVYRDQLAAAYQYGLTNLASYKTLGDLFNAVVSKAPPAAALQGERQAIGAALDAALSSPTAPVDPEVVTPLFTRVIAALRGAK